MFMGMVLLTEINAAGGLISGVEVGVEVGVGEGDGVGEGEKVGGGVGSALLILAYQYQKPKIQAITATKAAIIIIFIQGFLAKPTGATSIIGGGEVGTGRGGAVGSSG